MRFVWFLLFAGCGVPGGDALESTCPASGALVITELAIRGSSYVEVYNGGHEEVALDALTILVAGSGAPREVAARGRIGPGRYGVVAVTSLADAGGTVSLACDGRLIDEAKYSAVKGEVLALDGARPPDAVWNDLAEHWCAQPGSAGGANAACDVAVCSTGRAPKRGDLLVNEVMRDPAGADEEGEWIELYVAADGDVLLDGLEIEEVASSTRKFTLVAEPCFTAESRTLVVLPLGGKESPRLVRGSGLFNDTAKMTVRVGGVVIDQVAITCGRNGTSCAWVDDAWCESHTPTPGEDNACAE